MSLPTTSGFIAPITSTFRSVFGTPSVPSTPELTSGEITSAGASAYSSPSSFFQRACLVAALALPLPACHSQSTFDNPEIDRAANTVDSRDADHGNIGGLGILLVGGGILGTLGYGLYRLVQHFRGKRAAAKAE